MVWFFLMVMLIIIIGAIKFELDHSLKRDLPLVEKKRRDRAQRIIAQGGPQSLQEYLELFPEACSQCGGQTLYESAETSPSFLSQLLRRKPLRTWVCTRCGANNFAINPIKPLKRLRRVNSPYLPSEQSAAIAEPPYHHAPVYPVYLHNDNETTMEFVVQVLEQVFCLPNPVAIQMTITVHQAGRSFIAALPKQVAQERIALAHQLAKEQGYPLQFTLEQEWIRTYAVE